MSAESSDGFDSFRFAWPARVNYTAQRFGNELLIQFDRPVDGDVAGAASGLGGFIASARLGDRRREVVVGLTGNHRLRTYRDGNNVVIDVGERQAVATRPAPSASPPTDTSGSTGTTATEGLATGPTVPVRVGTHPTYRRLVFDWPSNTPYSITEANGAARVAFGKPARIDANGLASRLPSQFAGLRAEVGGDGNANVVIPIPDGVRVRHFLSGTKVVVDLIQDSSARSPGPSSPSAQSHSAQSPNPQSPNPQSPSSETPVAQSSTPPPQNTQPDPTAPAPAAGGAALASQFGLAPSQNPNAASPPEPQTPGAPQAAPPQPVSAPPVSAPAPQETAQTPAQAIPPASVSAPQAATNGTAAIPPASVSSEGVATGEAETRNASAAPTTEAPRPSDQGASNNEVAAGAGAASPTESDVAVDPTNLVASLRASQNATISGPSLPVLVSRSNDATSIRFDWKQPVAAAVFLRAEHLWVVFDEPVTFELSALTASPGQIMGRPEQIAVAPGAALRVPLVAGIAPRVWRDGDAWIVDLQPQAMRPDVVLNVGTQQSSPQGPRVFVLAEGVGRTSVARDPEVGDLLFMIPMTPLSRGIDVERNYSQFNILGSVQGMVVQPLIEELEVRVLPDGVAITASKLSGLEVSKPQPGKVEEELVGRRGDGLPPGLAPGRIFNLVSWRQGARESEFLRVKQDIQRQISEATSISRSGPRLSLAQFYFANGLAAESMGLLRTIATSDEELARRPDVKALRGASHFMLGRYAEAEEDLDDRSLNGFAEAELWRGASNAAQGKWASAIEHFARAGEIPGGYPRNFATQLAMLAAEAAIRAGDFRGAGGFLDAIAEGRPTPGEQARLDYLRGRVLYASGDVDTALDYWRRLSNETDRWSRVRAKRALIEHN
ncbi:MAG: hypothetical protein ISP41_19395, partial [Alphaproteobacteria bacterium]|nr:hypothetical protein [Alphaproteobacteria bacterium]